MNKIQVARLLRKQIYNGEKISSSDVVKVAAETHKKLVYMALREDGSCAYVGMVGNAKTASLYMRFHGNGNAAHDKKMWWREVSEVRFKHFPGASVAELKLIERLVILACNQPDNNDVDSSESKLRSLCESLKLCPHN